MTQVYIITGIIIMIIVLICYVFIRQTISKRKKEKIRLYRALDKRATELLHMLNTFPDNFLPKDLQVFLYRCIVDTFEQLVKLSPDEPEHLEHFKTYSANMEAVMRAPQSPDETSLQSPTQINEIRQYLNHLGHFMQKWRQRGNINEKQYGHYKEVLKKLITQLMADNYMLSAKQSEQMEKTKLAIHYYLLAKNLLIKEGLTNTKKSRLGMINEKLDTLEKKVQKEENSNVTATEIKDGEDVDGEQKQWDEFEQESGWKKKNVYD